MSIMAFLASPLFDKLLGFIPNPQERARVREQMQTDLLKMASEERKGQVELNKAEATHASLFVAGWRPFIGWVGGFALLWTFILYPIATFVATLTGYAGPLPQLETNELMALVTAMLGVGAMRSFDKQTGTDTKSIGTKPKQKPNYNE